MLSERPVAVLRHCARLLGMQTLEVLLPQTCMLCGGPACQNRQGLCLSCYGRFETIAGPVCTHCGTVFASPCGGDHLCGECYTRRAYYDRARSAGVYVGNLRRAIHALKFNRRSLLAGALAQFADDRFTLGARQNYAALVPVPLHPRRLRSRGYNQALLLALHLGRQWRVPVERNYLQRMVWNVPQTSLRRTQRIKAVRGAFVCCGRRYAGKRLLLVDDVFTSGATADECARTLKHAGAAAVDVLTVARTLKDHPECL